jgi:L-ribulose-5-phosphate 4-epimerase
MVTHDKSLREQIINIACCCHEMGLILYSQGNFSTRIEGTDEVLITPSGIPYKEMTVDDIVKVSLEGEILEGEHQPSSEITIHLAAYKAYPRIHGCAHTESPYVNALAVLNRTVPNILGNYVYLFGGQGLGVVPGLRSTTQEFADATLNALQGKLGVIWKNHGMFCIGETLQMAFKRCWAAEQSAKVYHLALSLGEDEPDLIAQDVVDEMVEMAKSLGWI